MRDETRQRDAEQAAAITTAVVAAHGRGQNGAQIAQALKLTDREVWLALFYTGRLPSPKRRPSPRPRRVSGSAEIGGLVLQPARRSGNI